MHSFAYLVILLIWQDVYLRFLVDFSAIEDCAQILYYLKITVQDLGTESYDFFPLIVKNYLEYMHIRKNCKNDMNSSC